MVQIQADLAEITKLSQKIHPAAERAKQASKNEKAPARMPFMDE